LRSLRQDIDPPWRARGQLFVLSRPGLAQFEKDLQICGAETLRRLNAALALHVALLLLEVGAGDEVITTR